MWLHDGTLDQHNSRFRVCEGGIPEVDRAMDAVAGAGPSQNVEYIYTRVSTEYYKGQLQQYLKQLHLDYLQWHGLGTEETPTMQFFRRAGRKKEKISKTRQVRSLSEQPAHNRAPSFLLC